MCKLETKTIVISPYLLTSISPKKTHNSPPNMKTIINKIKSRTYGNVVAVLAGLLLAYVVYMLSRVA
ncbi:MAG: hypothetical protein IIY34_00625, partial [Clostridia bacterium]|nr:hypothetical protein [Clostridia bacterium]